MRSAFQRWLCRPAAPLLIVAIALGLALPALFTGLSGDDFFHELVLTGRGDLAVVPKSPMAMFVWASGDPAQAHAMMEVGMTGWWTDPKLVMAYFRPISVVTHWLDYRLWPHSPELMHLHSLLWFALALLPLWSLYSRLLAPPAGAAFLPALALLLYAIDDAHGMTLAWLANRNALVAFALGLPVLVLHDRFVRDDDRRAGRAAPLVLLFALLAGEAALAVVGYLFAYALYLDPAPRSRALRRLLPYGVVVALWSLCYRALGFGARGSGLVIDPGSEPVRYLVNALERVPVLLTAQLAFPPSDSFEAYPLVAPWLPPLMTAVMLSVLLVMALALWPLLRARPVARFFALGAVLSALPVCAQFPHDRLLLFVGVGGMGLIAMLLAEWLQPSADLRSLLGRRAQRVVTYGCAVLHLGIAPLWLPLRVRAPLDGQRMIGTAERSIDDTAAVRTKTVVLMNPPVDAYAGYVPPMRAARGQNRPFAVRWLATAGSDVRLERVDAHTLRVSPEHGFLALPSERMQRNPDNRMPVGYTVRFTDLSIEVASLTADGRPAEILARFDKPLEDPHYELMEWRGKVFVPFVPPAVGQTRVLPKVDFTGLLR
jgi:hypothetical protein